MTSKGQVTVPAEIRQMDGFQPGDKVVFRRVDGQVIVEPASAVVDRLAGMFADLAEGKPPMTIEEMKEVAAAGWAEEGMADMEYPVEEV